MAQRLLWTCTPFLVTRGSELQEKEKEKNEADIGKLFSKIPKKRGV